MLNCFKLQCGIVKTEFSHRPHIARQLALIPITELIHRQEASRQSNEVAAKVRSTYTFWWNYQLIFTRIWNILRAHSLTKRWSWSILLALSDQASTLLPSLSHCFPFVTCGDQRTTDFWNGSAWESWEVRFWIYLLERVLIYASARF